MKKLTKRNSAVVLTKLDVLVRGDPSLGPDVVERLTTAINDIVHGRETPVKAINTALDRLIEADVFGTEGQLDPRGDHRNEEDES